MKYVYDAIALTREKLNGKVPLIGFAGAPVSLPHLYESMKYLNVLLLYCQKFTGIKIFVVLCCLKAKTVIFITIHKMLLLPKLKIFN